MASSACRHADNIENQASHQEDKEQEFGNSRCGHSDTRERNAKSPRCACGAAGIRTDRMLLRRISSQLGA